MGITVRASQNLIFFKKGITTLHGVTLDDYRIDWDFKKLVEEIQRVADEKGLPVFLKIKSELVERQDTAGWKLDRFKLTAEVRDARRDETTLLDFAGLEMFLDRLKKPKWKIWLR